MEGVWTPQPPSRYASGSCALFCAVEREQGSNVETAAIETDGTNGESTQPAADVDQIDINDIIITDNIVFEVHKKIASCIFSILLPLCSEDEDGKSLVFILIFLEFCFLVYCILCILILFLYACDWLWFEMECVVCPQMSFSGTMCLLWFLIRLC